MSDWTFISDSKPKARKRYQCCLCRESIEKGEIHVARRGVGAEGRVTTRMHLDCEKVTHSWTEYDWENVDFCDFKKLKVEMEGKP